MTTSDPLAVPPDLPATDPQPAAPAAPAAEQAPGDPYVPPEAPAPGGGALDSAGVAWDGTKHRNPPITNKNGTWQRLRGNAALAAQGKPMSLFGKSVAAKPRPAAAPLPPPPAPVNWPAPAAPEDGGPVEEAPPEIRPLETYGATARSLVVAQFGTARMLFGPEAAPDADERRAWEDQWRDALFQWQVTPFGPLVGLIVLLIDSIAKRINNPAIRARAKAIWSWIAKRKGAEQSPPAPAAAQPPPPPPPPAPRVEVVDMAAYGK